MPAAQAQVAPVRGTPHGQIWAMSHGLCCDVWDIVASTHGLTQGSLLKPFWGQADVGGDFVVCCCLKQQLMGIRPNSMVQYDGNAFTMYNSLCTMWPLLLEYCRSLCLSLF